MQKHAELIITLIFLWSILQAHATVINMTLVIVCNIYSNKFKVGFYVLIEY